MKSTRRVYNRPQDDSVVLEEQVGAPSAPPSFLRARLCWRFVYTLLTCGPAWRADRRELPAQLRRGP